MGSRGSITLALVALAILVGVPGVSGQEDQPQNLVVFAEEEGCPHGQDLCLVPGQGDVSGLAAGDRITITFENRAGQSHTLHVADLNDRAEDGDTPGRTSIAHTGQDGVLPGRYATFELTIPEDAEGLYLWCNLEHHEAQGMHLQVPVEPSGPSPSDPWVLAAGAAVLGLVAVAWRFWDELKLALVGLYNRLTRQEVLEHGDRERILELVDQEPGIHFRELARRLDMGHGILDHHLRKLEDAGMLGEHKTESHRCYFRPGETDQAERQALAAVKAGGPLRIMEALATSPGSSITQVADEAGLARSTASHHVDRLADVGVIAAEIQGRAKRLHLTPLGEEVLERLQDRPTA